MKLVKWTESRQDTVALFMLPTESEVSTVEDWLVDICGMYFLLPMDVVANAKAEWETIKKANGGKEDLPLPTISLGSLMILSNDTAKILLDEVLNHKDKSPKDQGLLIQ